MADQHREDPARLLKSRKSGPLFVTERKARVQLPAADLDEHGHARLFYQQAAALFSEASGGATLHQLRHSALTHDAEDGGRGADRAVLPMTAEEIRAAEQAAVTPAQRLTIALAAVHAARPKAIRELTLDNIDLPGRRITLAGHRQRLGDLTVTPCWPGSDTGVPSCRTPPTGVLLSRISALGTGPVSPDHLDKHQLHGISLEQIRRDRILAEALAAGDPVHVALVFNIDHTNAMAYANAARNLFSSPAEQALSYRPG